MKFLAFFLCFCPLICVGQRKMSTREYVELYAPTAIEKMREFKIPASITLAQGVLESGNGGSELAIRANNHFGIKCGGKWTGGKVYHDDDARGECFRSYRSAEESYRDHSLFLTQNPRYGGLFALDIMDYKEWAHGLKRAGYATNPAYATMLIKIIEDNRLYEYDRRAGADIRERGGIVGRVLDARDRAVAGYVNGVKYVVTAQDDTFESVARRMGLSVKKMLKINDLSYTVALTEGTALYVKNKKRRSSSSYYHEVTSGETLHSVSQKYGIQMVHLQKMNPVVQFAPAVGTRLKLR